DVETFARSAEWLDGGENGMLAIRKAEDRREAARVATRGAGAAREVRLRPGQCFPENVVEDPHGALYCSPAPFTTRPACAGSAMHSASDAASAPLCVTSRHHSCL